MYSSQSRSRTSVDTVTERFPLIVAAEVRRGESVVSRWAKASHGLNDTLGRHVKAIIGLAETGPGNELPHRAKGKIAEQAAQTLRRVVEISVVTELSERISGNPGLLGIDLPWVQVEHDWTVFCSIHSLNAPPGPPIGKQPKIAAARDRE